MVQTLNRAMNRYGTVHETNRSVQEAYRTVQETFMIFFQLISQTTPLEKIH